MYLSAFSTADREDGKLVDEGIHVVSSFQLAEFRNVIGPLWETVDWACSEVVEKFYKSLFANDPEEPTWDGNWRFSLALHSAVTKLRANDPDLPLLWRHLCISEGNSAAAGNPKYGNSTQTP